MKFLIRAKSKLPNQGADVGGSRILRIGLPDGSGILLIRASIVSNPVQSQVKGERGAQGEVLQDLAEIPPELDSGVRVGSFITEDGSTCALTRHSRCFRGEAVRLEIRGDNRATHSGELSPACS